jgi:hypothetical protein
VRHPIYTGIVLAITGTALAYDQWRALAAIPLFWLSFTIKRLKEEEFMRQTFGSQLWSAFYTGRVRNKWRNSASFRPLGVPFFPLNAFPIKSFVVNVLEAKPLLVET